MLCRQQVPFPEEERIGIVLVIDFGGPFLLYLVRADHREICKI